MIDASDDLDHEELTGLRADVERVRGLFDPQRMAAGGVRGIAVFACGPAGVLEVVADRQRQVWPTARKLCASEVEECLDSINDNG